MFVGTAVAQAPAPAKAPPAPAAVQPAPAAVQPAPAAVQPAPAAVAPVPTAPSKAKCPKKLVVATKLIAPFVMNNPDGSCCQGFSIDLWSKLIKRMNQSLPSGEPPYEFWDGKTEPKTFLKTGSLSTLMDTLRPLPSGAGKTGRTTKADVAIAAITITPERGKEFSFSQSYFDSGLRIMIRADEGESTSDLLSKIFSPALLKIMGGLVLIILFAAHIIWLLERKRNPLQFNKGYFRGIFDAIWWASVTVTTVGYGDRVPQGIVGRMFALFWMFSGVVLISIFTASVTTTLTVNSIKGGVKDLNGLRGKVVATTEGSVAESILKSKGFTGDKLKTYKLIDDAYPALRDGDIDAVVYDWPSLVHYANNKGDGEFRVVGEVFDEQHYGIAMPRGSPCKEIINAAYYALQREQGVKALRTKWLELKKK
jgi:polar amino acid transport system substrate-binding protein